MIVTDDRVAHFVAHNLGVSPCPPYTAMGIEKDGTITAGVLFNCFEGANVHITACGTGWTLGFMRAVGDYVYRQLGCERMTMTTEQPHVALLALKLGGVIEGRMRNHFGKDRHAMLIGILREEYRYSNVAPKSTRLAHLCALDP